MPPPTSVSVLVPATTANLGPGFDCLGLALDLHNRVELAVADATTVHVTGHGADRLPRDETNLVLRSAARVAQVAGRRPPGWALRQHNEIPLARGLGSSSAAIVGGLVAANLALEVGMAPRDLLNLAVQMEGHPDNVAPALLGGLTVCCSDPADDAGRVGTGLGVARFDPTPGLRAALAIPDYEVSTEAARRVLPAQVSHADAVFNTGHCAAVLAALISGDLRLLGQAMKDRLHEPYRAPLVRGMAEGVAAALAAGAHAAALSGSGPTLVAFVTSALPEGEKAVLEAMVAALRAQGVSCQGLVVALTGEGAKVA